MHVSIYFFVPSIRYLFKETKLTVTTRVKCLFQWQTLSKRVLTTSDVKHLVMTCTSAFIHASLGSFVRPEKSIIPYLLLKHTYIISRKRWIMTIFSGLTTCFSSFTRANTVYLTYQEMPSSGYKLPSSTPSLSSLSRSLWSL